MKKLYLVDVSSMFFRAFYAIPPLNNDKGMPTNALYGFLSMTIKLIRDIRPDYMVFCFDRKEPSFRLELYPEYKANRDEMPEALVPQIPYVKSLTDILGIPRLDKERYEADDVIGSLVQLGRKQDLEVVIVSGDKDFAQLISPHVSMYDPMRETHYDINGVVEKWGVKPEQMIDYLALVGDSSDNIPGVRGIGPKGAQKLLSEFQTLDGIYKNLEKISSKSLKQKLIDHKKNAYLSQELVKIVTDVDLNVSPDDLRLKAIDREALRSMLAELGFKTFERNLLNENGGTINHSVNGAKAKKVSPPVEKPAEKQISFESVANDLTEVQWSLAEVDRAIEPYSEIWVEMNERGLFFCYKNQVIHCAQDSVEIGKILSKKKLSWKGFDLKEIWKYLKIQEPIAVWDEMLAAYVVRAGNIENFPETYTTYTGKAVPDLATTVQLFDCHFELEKILQKKMKDQQSEKVFETLELPLIPVLYSMENYGVQLDVEELNQQSKDLEKDIRKLETVIHKEAGEYFNIASPKQLGHILFDKMGLASGRRTKTGFSTGSDVLEKLKSTHPIIDSVLEYRELAKLKSTYVDALPGLVNKETARVHTHFKQAATTTGRLSSVNPNLQNIPIRTERGRLVRKAFVAKSGCVLLSADYSQIELRVLAHITDDPGLCSAFAKDVDIHTATASEVFGVSLKEVTPDLRRTAKAINFGIAYGQGAFGLAENLDISRGEATEIIERYFTKFKNVREYMGETVRLAQEQGYVETVFGRRRYIDELKSKNQNIKKFGERAAINAPIQGTASDLVKLAMIKLFDEISIPMLLQVHDELLFECPKDEIEEHSQLIRKVMEGVAAFRVPLAVNIASGPNWEDAHS